jgi:hypothetical protein
MYNTRPTTAERFLVVLLVSILSGCATTKAPNGWLPAVSDVQSDTYGGWLILSLQRQTQAEVLDGEFIGIRSDSVFLLTDKSEGRVVAMSSIRRAEVQVHQKQTGRVVASTAVGILGTISHGLLLIVTAPVWLITGIIAASSASYLGEFEKSDPDIAWWTKMSEHARFPQGVPYGVDIATLRGRELE